MAAKKQVVPCEGVFLDDGKRGPCPDGAQSEPGLAVCRSCKAQRKEKMTESGYLTKTPYSKSHRGPDQMELKRETRDGTGH